MPAALLDRSRASLAKAVREKVAGDEFQAINAQIWDTPGPRWFTQADAIWEVHADTAMFVGGIRALLLQSLHPVAMHGVSEHSGFRGDPWGRLQRTSRYLATTTYGAVPDAERSIAIVRAIHKRVRGIAPDGSPYQADDPHLLAWVHVAEVDSFLTTHQTFGHRPLNARRADEYVRQTGLVAARLGMLDPPTSVAELNRRLQSYRSELAFSAAAEDAADLLLKTPPLHGPARLGYAALAAGAISTLPTWARTMLELPTRRASDRMIAQPLARTAVSTIRWALSGSSVV